MNCNLHGALQTYNFYLREFQTEWSILKNEILSISLHSHKPERKLIINNKEIL